MWLVLLLRPQGRLCNNYYSNTTYNEYIVLGSSPTYLGKQL